MQQRQHTLLQKLAAAATTVGPLDSLSLIWGDRASEAVEEALGDPQSVPSARAQWEASRSEEQKAATNKDRKSQVGAGCRVAAAL